MCQIWYCDMFYDIYRYHISENETALSRDSTHVKCSYESYDNSL